MRITRDRRGAGRATLGLAVAFAVASVLSVLPGTVAADWPPTVAIVAPAGGEVWSAGSTHPITWIMWDEDESLYVIMEYGRDVEWGIPITEGYYYTGENTYEWDVPVQDMRDVTVLVCAVDFGGKPTCEASEPFRVDATPPTVRAHSPSGGNADLAAPVLVDFSERMNASRTASAISIVPDPGGVAVTPHNATAFRVDHAPFGPATTYTVTVACSAWDASDPGNPLAGCPFEFSFTTSARPSIDVRTPAGGERWTGGSVHALEWTAWDPEDDVASLGVQLDWSLDGVVWTAVAGGLPGDGSYAWFVPVVHAAAARVRATVTDTRGLTGAATSAPFAIDSTGPTVRSYAPTGVGVDLAVPILIDFSEPMNPSRTESAITVAPDPGGVSAAMRNATAIRVDHAPFAPWTTYTVTVSCAAWDASDPGNPLAGCPFEFSFTTSARPSIDVRTPAGGERWTGGSVHALEWTAWDLEDPPSALEVRLEWSEDGVTWTFVAGPLPGDASHAWTVPLVDAGTARVRATVNDTQGLKGIGTSEPFEIDSTSPAVVATSPAEGASDVALNAPVIATFDSPVKPFGAEGIGVRDPSGRWISGTITWDSTRQVRFSPTVPFRTATVYTAQLNASILDASDPGNAMGSPYLWTFVTRPNVRPSIAFTAAPARTISGGSGWTLAWAAADPEEPAQGLQVYLESSEGGPFVPLAGPLPAAGTFPWTAPRRDLPLAMLRARVTDSQGASAEALASFSVDATPPVVTSATPPPGAVDVAPDVTVYIVFSEPVNAWSSAQTGLRETDTGTWVAVNSLATSDANWVLLSPAFPLRELATYEVFVNASVTDGSAPGNPLVPGSWTFRIRPFPPTAAILEPKAGVRWTGGATQVLRVAAADAHDPRVYVTVDVTVDGGATFPIVTSRPMDNGEAAFPITVPAIDAPVATLRACARDEFGASACASVPIGIDATPPRLLEVTPAPGARPVHPEASLVLTFSETVVRSSVEAALSLSPSAPLAFRWTRTHAEDDTLVVDHPPLLEGRTYAAVLRCDVRDASSPGLTLGGACPVAWTFTTAATPQVRILNPLGGERLTGGTTHEVRWVAWDDEPLVRVLAELSLDGGGSFAPVFGPESLPVGDDRIPIALPEVDASEAVVRITVRDALGLRAEARSAPFAIDGTPPYVLSATPADGVADVSPLEDVVLVFSESMDPASLPGAFTSTPPFRDPVVTWSTGRVPFDTLRISHAAIRLGSHVTVRLDGLRDLSQPGHAFSGGLAFTVTPDRQRPTPVILVAAEVTEGEVVVLDATASTDNDEIVSYAWTIADEEGVAVASFRGPRVEYRATQVGSFTVTVEVADAAGNAASANAPLRIRALGSGTLGEGETVLPPESSLFGLLALSGAGATALSLTDRGRSWLSRVLVLPLYTKLRPEAVLDQETRGMIRGYVRVHPGDSYTDIKRNLGLANGALAYHLQVLEREGIIRSTTRGSRRVYYPSDVPIPEDGGGLHEIQGRLLKNIEETPGMAIRDLAGILGVSSQLALYHVRKLGEEGLVRFERRGVKLRVFATSLEERRQRRQRLGDA